MVLSTSKPCECECGCTEPAEDVYFSLEQTDDEDNGIMMCTGCGRGQHKL